jgi:putative tryptophan/tyrosine transport system substrate-binding protein
LEARGLDDIHSAFQVARRERADGLIVVEDPLTFSHRKLISDLAAEDRLPAVHGFKEFVIVGGLMSYGANLEDLFSPCRQVRPRTARWERHQILAPPCVVVLSY